MRLYFFIHYSNTNANSYNHIISFAQKVYTVKRVLPIIVLNSNSILFFFRKGCLHISKRIFLSVSNLIPKDSILHFWSPRNYIQEYYYSLVNKFKLVIHLEDNYHFLSQCSSNNCFSKSQSSFIISKFEYFTSINKNLSTLYSIPKHNFFLLKPPSIIHQKCKYNDKSNILHLGTINQYNYRQIYVFIKENQAKDIRFVLVGKNFFPETFCNLAFCNDYGFVKESKLKRIFSSILASFVPYLNPEFDQYRYPSKVPDLLVAGVPTFLPNYEYYQGIFDYFPELSYEQNANFCNTDFNDKLICFKDNDYRHELSLFAREYFVEDSSFKKYLKNI